MSKKDNQVNQEKEFWRDEVAEIKQDSVHSSIFLSDKALDVIEEFINRHEYQNRTELIQNLSKLGNALVRAKPLMALIYARTHRVIESIQSIPKEMRNIEEIKNTALQEVKNIRGEAVERRKKITRLGARLILDQHVVLTHSSSGIVESILLEAKRLKKRFRLICTESRPRYEGRELAKRMAKAGIKTRLIPDADIARAVEKAHFIFTGTDRITENTFINKTGTAAIACLSKQLDKPFYIAADSDKILLKRTYPVKFSSQQENEILGQFINNLMVENIYFEEVPLSFLHKVICETGIFEIDEFIERFL